MVNRKILIAGPCAAESEEQVLLTAKMLSNSGIRCFRAGVWKPRTKPGGFEGYGEQGLQWLQAVKRQTGLQIATEVATPEHVQLALIHGVDILWIGARTVSNPFSVQEIAEALRRTDINIMVKNPAMPDLELWTGAIERLQNAGIQRITAIHRGFYAADNPNYRNAPQWNIPAELKRRFPHVPLLCDPSHIAGDAARVPAIAQKAMDLNHDGLFVEVHCCPQKALSDGFQQLTPAEFANMIKKLILRPTDSYADLLLQMRQQIDEIDENIFALLSKRMKIAQKIGDLKKENKIAALQSKRFAQIEQKFIEQAEILNLSKDFIKNILENIHSEALKKQI
ncbi:MAG: bifunctional 3-deoxy-7-phosphoheptulonate synthase/chorismate mutase type II [Prevotellaceae bacterium]|jgi:chorismate mutase|nr:bifunctional 3-deoxy-7-phosphoheptulonate synthase/chorismate mutase type II [Prevotellaceae bacterium]